jgi:hypothetical protein
MACNVASKHAMWHRDPLANPCDTWCAEADELRTTYGFNELEEKSTPKWITYLHMVRPLWRDSMDLRQMRNSDFVADRVCSSASGCPSILCP